MVVYEKDPKIGRYIGHRSYKDVRKRKGNRMDKVLHLCSDKSNEAGISLGKESNGHTISICNL